MFEILQFSIIGGLVVISVLIVVQKMIPKKVSHYKFVLASQLAKPERSHFSHWCAKKLFNSLVPAQSDGCHDSGCGSCSGCGLKN